MKIITKFNKDQKIYIKELKLWGRIVSIFYNGQIEYNVRFFQNSEVKIIYFLEDELSDTEEKENLGFK